MLRFFGLGLGPRRARLCSARLVMSQYRAGEWNSVVPSLQSGLLLPKHFGPLGRSEINRLNCLPKSYAKVTPRG